MSSFFGSSGSNTNGSSGGNNGTGSNSSAASGGGGWGSFLKQGLSTIESKLDMVLDINVPIPGGGTGTLTSFSPHANILPSTLTGSGSPSSTSTTNTPPKHQPPPQLPAALNRTANEEQEGSKKDASSRLSSQSTSARSRNSAHISKTAGTASSADNSVPEDVTVDPITGMITTIPGIKRISTPPVGNSQPSSQGSTQISAAAAAAAANRERLEQRMRGIFKKTTESPPTTPSRTPDPASPNPSAVVSNTSSTRPSLQDDGKRSSSVSVDKVKDKFTPEDKYTPKEKEVAKDEDIPKEKEVAKDKDLAKDMGTDNVKDMDKGENKESIVGNVDATTTDKRASTPTLTEEIATKQSEAVTLSTNNDGSTSESNTANTTTEEKQDEKTPVTSSPNVSSTETETNQMDTVNEPTKDLNVNGEARPSSVGDVTSSPQRPSTESTTATEDTVGTGDVADDKKEDESSTLAGQLPKEVTGTGEETPKIDIASNASVVAEDGPERKQEKKKEEEASINEKEVTKGAPQIPADVQQLKRVVEQREEQLFKVMQEHSQLLEKFRDLEDAKAAQETLQNAKVTGLEKIVEGQKKELELARVSNLTSQPKSIQKTLEEQRALLEEKDEQIRGLLAEGEVLSKKELKSLTIIKTLRAKGIETEKTQQDVQRKLDRALADHSEAQQKFARLADENKQLNDNNKSLNDSIQRQNKQTSKMEAELAQLREDKANLQMGLDRSWQELAEARKASTELSNQTHAAALDREVKLNKELQEQMDELVSKHTAIETNLRQEIQELRVSLSNREELAGEKEDQLLTEIRTLQARLEQNDNESFELQETLDEARRPLLLQIQLLQNQQGLAQRNWEKIEKGLARRVTEAEEDAASAQERERAARERLEEVKSQTSGLEARIEALRLADTQLRSEVSAAKRLCAEKEEAARQAQADLSRERVNRERAVEEAKEDVERKWRQQQQAEVDKLKQQIQVLQQQRVTTNEPTLQPVPASARKTSVSPAITSPLLANASSMASVHPSQRASLESGHSLNNVLDALPSPSLDGILPSLSRTSSTHTVNTVSGLSSLASNVGASPAVAIERLNSMVRQLEGQVTFLTEQTRSINRNKDELSDELVRVTMELEELRIVAVKVPSLEQELYQLQERHKAALEMLGERTEEVHELRADIVDVKEAYRDQINELLSQIENSKR
ncbi:hypothetical protein BGZ94_008236 [Podila epigama]|nr:hypothetical protein BGZ94_008236 [Podila epigama]